jgi:hypothetical protein
MDEIQLIKDIFRAAFKRNSTKSFGKRTDVNLKGTIIIMAGKNGILPRCQNSYFAVRFARAFFGQDWKRHYKNLRDNPAYQNPDYLLEYLSYILNNR